MKRALAAAASAAASVAVVAGVWIHGHPGTPTPSSATALAAFRNQEVAFHCADPVRQWPCARVMAIGRSSQVVQPVSDTLSASRRDEPHDPPKVNCFDIWFPLETTPWDPATEAPLGRRTFASVSDPAQQCATFSLRPGGDEAVAGDWSVQIAHPVWWTQTVDDQRFQLCGLAPHCTVRTWRPAR